MRDDPAYRDILDAIDASNLSAVSVAWYGFGSFFTASDSFSDIDLLAVCSTVEETSVIRRKMAAICSEWPVHVLIMTEAEAAETNFVKSQLCIPLTAVHNELGGDNTIRPPRHKTAERAMPSELVPSSRLAGSDPRSAALESRRQAESRKSLSVLELNPCAPLP
jgi:hypothetical protein